MRYVVFLIAFVAVICTALCKQYVRNQCNPTNFYSFIGCMSGSNVAGLIPDRDSDSSDDEFLDALDKIENEPELEYVENVNTGLLVMCSFVEVRSIVECK